MMNQNDKDKVFDMNEEVLEKVSGGTETEELSELIVQLWKQLYGQSDESFRYVCKECGTVITGWNLGHFYDEVCAHISSHMPNFNLDNMPLPGNPLDREK